MQRGGASALGKIGGKLGNKEGKSRGGKIGDKSRGKSMEWRCPRCNSRRWAGRQCEERSPPCPYAQLTKKKVMEMEKMESGG